MSEPRLYRIDRICSILDISRRSYYRLVRDKKLHPIKVGGSVYVTAEDLQKCIGSGVSLGPKAVVNREDIEDEIAAFAALKARDEAIANGTFLAMTAAEWQKIRRGVSPTKVVREHRELSIKALATSAGLSEAAVVAIDAGLARGTVDELVAIARALKAPLDVIAGANVTTGPK